MSVSPLLDKLIDSLQILPGVGPKSAQRLAFYLLERNQQGACDLAEVITTAVEKIGHCEECRTLTEDKICSLCANPGRDDSMLCVVENPSDVMLMNKVTSYKGRYFVLMGHLSPLDGIGPEELGLADLARRLDNGGIKELILATNSTVEGEATAHYIHEMARKRQIRTTRLAHGVPMGGELEYVDGGTLSYAFQGRQDI